MGNPNLYNFATSELTQDAFICWLLSWSKPELDEGNNELKLIACNLIKKLLSRHGFEYNKEPKHVEIRQQYNDMDVVIVLDKKIALLIEDKVHSTSHSGQLDRYFKTLVKEFDEKSVFPIYFKTGDQSNYKHAINNGYQPFLRKDILKVLEEGINLGITNNIYQDYYDYLLSIDKNVKSFEKASIDKWSNAAWKGFFILLQERLGSGDWGYVPNQTGGFMGFWWHSFEKNGCSIYLQLEGSKLCFKIAVANKEDYKRLRQEWHNKVIKASSKLSFQAVKPGRFGYGGHMTIAKYTDDYRVVDSENIVDVEKTMNRLHKAEEVLNLALMK